MVDPIHFTNFELSEEGLEEYILFAIAVAGKSALPTAKRLNQLVDEKKPFKSIIDFGSEGNLRKRMKQIGFGCYNLKAKGVWWIANSKIDLKKCSVEELEKCPGIGPKTARFFLLHTRRKAQIACLDTHILSYLNSLGYNVPKSTPQSRKKYKEIEQYFLEICKKNKADPADFDLMIWNKLRVSSEYIS